MTNCQVCEAHTDGFMCRACTRTLERAIGDMTSLLHEVSVLATGQTNVYRASGPTRRDEELADLDEEYAHRMASIPAWLRSRDGRNTLPATRPVVNLDARDLLYDAYDTLLVWAGLLGADEISSSTVVGYLLDNVAAARFNEDAGQLHDEITYLHSRIVRAVDRSPSRVYAGPCHAELDEGGRCARALFAWPSADEIECDGWRPPADRNDTVDVGCHAVHIATTRADWLLAELAGALLPLDMWRAALPNLLRDRDLAWPTRSTWWRWVGTGRLLPKSLDRNGIELFRGGDLIELVESEQARIVGNRNRTTRRTA